MKRKLKGIVFSGTGEGEFYMSQEGYEKQFNEILGFIPFPGTLNVKVKEEEAKKFIEGYKNTVFIREFRANGRSFGGLRCYEVKIKGIDCALIIPDRTQYKRDVVEIISKEKLRKRLGLNDDDSIVIEHE